MPDYPPATPALHVTEPSLAVQSSGGMPTVVEDDKKDVPWNVEEEITYEQVKRWSEDTESGVILIDVREAPDFESGHILNSKNLPLSIFEQALSKDQGPFEGALLVHDRCAMRPTSPNLGCVILAVDFMRTYGFPKPGIEEKIVLYCRSGRRSTIAADLASGAGFSRVRNYKGSWLEYEAKSGVQAGAAKSA
ncbi:BQ5605_C007g04662 [Microbotryum silenes-dioicae]|uniref:BQ5605_C007g04662 protein n=1 Tax=Microbotryum silenes-dioicae TaxID=796604 RepID=A0A2X0P9Z9_9BASI|nr:BQ5605_C007g04662 [Microbotryum silenes-dioicae]